VAARMYQLDAFHHILHSFRAVWYRYPRLFCALGSPRSPPCDTPTASRMSIDSFAKLVSQRRLELRCVLPNLRLGQIF